MVSLANDLIARYIYVLESDAVRNQNWLPTVANIDLSANFTEGTDFFKLQIPKQWIKGGTTGITAKKASGGKTYVTRTSQKAYSGQLQGFEVVGTDANNIEKFIMSSAHTATSVTTFKYYYLIIKRSATEYVPFTDDNDTVRDYCKIVITPDWKITWNESKERMGNIQINYHSAWGAS